VAEEENLAENVMESGNGKRSYIHVGVGKAYETSEEI
jgi:hypothetical protein